MIGDTARQTYLIRVVRDVGYCVFRLKTREPLRHWLFNGGVAVVTTSLSDGLETAAEALRVREPS